MITINADLHIHTVLSPCSNLEMSPRNIVKAALQNGLQCIGISDHNSTLQCKTVYKIANDNGLFVLCGAEVTSAEDVHTLAFFENFDLLNEFQEYLEEHQIKVPNKISTLGDQVVVDEKDRIVREIQHYLGMALDQHVDEIERKVKSLNGIYIPAHVDRSRYSYISHLGFVPDNIQADALEIFRMTNVHEFREKYPKLNHFSIVKNSDSHYLESVGKTFSEYQVNALSFKEIKLALQSLEGRKVTIPDV